MQRLDVLRLKAVLHGADVHGNGLRRDRRCGDDAVHHPLGSGQLGEGLAVDLGHDLAGVYLGGVHRQNDVCFVQAGQRHKGVHIGDALLTQQLGIRTVAVDDQHAGELLAHLLAAGRITVDDGHPLLDVLQLLDQIVGHPACTDDHDVAGLGLEQVQLAEEGFQIPGRSRQVDLVPGPQRKHTRGDDRLAAAGDGADQNFDPDVAVQVRQLQAHQRVVVGQAVLDQLKPLAAELLTLDGRRETQHAGDLTRRGFFRVDEHRQTKVIAHKAQLLLILRVADTRNRVLRAQLFGDEAGQDVDLITGRCGDQQVCAVLKRLLLHVIAAAVAGQTAHVIDIDNVLDQGRVSVDDDDVVIFRRKLGGQGTANLAEADDHDSHTNAPFLFFKAGTHVGATIGRPRSLIAALRSPIVSCMASGQRASNARPY